MMRGGGPLGSSICPGGRKSTVSCFGAEYEMRGAKLYPGERTPPITIPHNHTVKCMCCAGIRPFFTDVMMPLHMRTLVKAQIFGSPHHCASEILTGYKQCNPNPRSHQVSMTADRWEIVTTAPRYPCVSHLLTDAAYLAPSVGRTTKAANTAAITTSNGRVRMREMVEITSDVSISSSGSGK